MRDSINDSAAPVPPKPNAMAIIGAAEALRRLPGYKPPPEARAYAALSGMEEAISALSHTATLLNRFGVGIEDENDGGALCHLSHAIRGYGEALETLRLQALEALREADPRPGAHAERMAAMFPESLSEPSADPTTDGTAGVAE